MKLTNNHGLPETLYNAIKKLTYDPRESDPKRISITTLIGNPRPKILALKHWDEMEEDAGDHIWRILGSGVHDIIEKMSKAEGNNIITEEKLIAKLDDYTVVGKLDLYDGNLCSVEDWKITSIWSVKFGKHAEWEEQLNPYAWLLRKAGFEVKSLHINAIIKDWRKGETLRYDDYPKIPFKRIPVNLWTFEEQEKFVQHRLDIFKEAYAMPLDELPICSPDERWAKGDVYAVYKNANKTASKLLETAAEAEQYAKDNFKPTDVPRIVKRPGEDLKCTEYCTSAPFCSYWKETYGQRS